MPYRGQIIFRNFANRGGEKRGKARERPNHIHMVEGGKTLSTFWGIRKRSPAPEFKEKTNRKNRHFFEKFFRFPKSESCRCPLNPQKKGQS